MDHKKSTVKQKVAKAIKRSPVIQTLQFTVLLVGGAIRLRASGTQREVRIVSFQVLYIRYKQLLYKTIFTKIIPCVSCFLRLI
jgi:hypothetical protein